jgi:hypothetical protein
VGVCTNICGASVSTQERAAAKKKDEVNANALNYGNGDYGNEEEEDGEEDGADLISSTVTPKFGPLLICEMIRNGNLTDIKY